jgi:hypothetical protein
MNTTVKNKMPSGNLVIRYSSIRDLYEVLIDENIILGEKSLDDAISSLKNSYDISSVDSVRVQDPFGTRYEKINH